MSGRGLLGAFSPAVSLFPLPGHKKGRSPRSRRTWPSPSRCTGSCRATWAQAKPWWPCGAFLTAVAGRLPGRPDGADRSPGRAAPMSLAADAGRAWPCRTAGRCGASGRSGSSCSPTARPAPSGPGARRAWPRGDVDIVVGTHALLTESVRFAPAGRGGDRRAAPLRGRAAGRPAGKGRAARCPTCW